MSLLVWPPPPPIFFVVEMFYLIWIAQIQNCFQHIWNVWSFGPHSFVDFYVVLILFLCSSKRIWKFWGSGLDWCQCAMGRHQPVGLWRWKVWYQERIDDQGHADLEFIKTDRICNVQGWSWWWDKWRQSGWARCLSLVAKITWRPSQLLENPLSCSVTLLPY